MGIFYQPSQRWVSCRRGMQCVAKQGCFSSPVMVHDTALAKDRLRDPTPGFWPWAGDPYPDTREVGIYFQGPITMNMYSTVSLVCRIHHCSKSAQVWR